MFDDGWNLYGPTSAKALAGLSLFRRYGNNCPQSHLKVNNWRAGSRGGLSADSRIVRLHLGHGGGSLDRDEVWFGGHARHSDFVNDAL